MSASPVVLSALAWSLLHAIWQGALIAGLLVILRRLFRHSSAEQRHALCLLALLTLPACWLLTFAILLRSGSGGSSGMAAQLLPEWAPWLLVGWSLGLGTLSTRTALGLWQLHRLSSLATRVDARWEAALERLRSNAGVKRAVRLATSTRVDVPLLIGWVRPVILLPPCVLTGLPPSAVEAVLLHELLHVRRHDWLVSLAQSAIEAFFFHVPATWWISACLREERELRCDAEAARACGDRLAYARALTELEGLRPARSPSRLAPSARGGSLVTRIRLLVQPNAAAPSGTGRGLSLALSPLVLLLLVLGASQWSARAAAPVESVARWRPVIDAAAERHQLDPDLLAAMASVESAGDPDAESSRGALGLMQVMPSTAARIAADRGLPAPDAELLRQPEYNIDAAAWYLARQVEHFEDPDEPELGMERAIAAYNAGPSRVRAWVAGQRELPPETRRYLANVRERWRGTRSAGLTRLSRHPLPEGRRTSGFGLRRHPTNGNTRLHRGLDLAASRGLPVLAAESGRVRLAKDNGAEGLVVVLDHGEGLETRYHHLDGLRVRVGEQVDAGETIGTVGSTGRSTGPHLHFELRKDGEPIDPESALPR